MRNLSSNNAGSDCSAVWFVQNGRSRVQRNVASDGFRTEYPYAGVVVVAENHSSEDDSSAAVAVETIRDVFAEGVAFGVDDALEDSFEEASDLIREKKLTGCSIAALAFSATHIWYALAGNCRIYRIDSDGVRCIVRDRSEATETGMPPDHPDYLKKIQSMDWWLGCPSQGKPVFGHTRIRRDTTYLIMTSGSWVQFESTGPAVNRKGVRKSMQGWINSLARDMKLAYRRQGGALAAVSGKKVRSDSSVSWRSLAVISVSVLLAGYLVLGNPFSCDREQGERTDLFSEEPVVEQIVQPIGPSIPDDSSHNSTQHGFFNLIPNGMQAENPDSIAAEFIDILPSLPLQTACIGLDWRNLPADSFAVQINSNPDIQWENFSPGIYSIKGDTASGILAQRALLDYPELQIHELDRIVTIRENGVAESARWLSSLSAELALSTGVIVETRSSVAGGAGWIRNYAVFANGNRVLRSDEPGGFAGDSLAGIPVLRSSVTYRLIIVP